MRRLTSVSQYLKSSCIVVVQSVMCVWILSNTSIIVTAERGRGRHAELKESQRALGYRWPTGTKLQYTALTVSHAFILGCEFNLRFSVSGTLWLPDMRSYPVCKTHT